MLRSINFKAFFVVLLSLGFLPEAFSFQAQAQKVHLSACSQKVCYALQSTDLQTSQLFPVWSFGPGSLEIRGLEDVRLNKNKKDSQFIEFASAIWDEVSQTYELKTRSAILIFDPLSGQLRSQ
jgi:hypothetical protein